MSFMETLISEMTIPVLLGGKLSGTTKLHCRTCGGVITTYKGRIGLEERMRRIRRHYKKLHPRKFKEMYKKMIRTKRERGLIK